MLGGMHNIIMICTYQRYNVFSEDVKGKKRMENTLGVDQGNYVLAMDHLKLGNEELIINN